MAPDDYDDDDVFAEAAADYDRYGGPWEPEENEA